MDGIILKYNQASTDNYEITATKSQNFPHFLMRFLIVKLTVLAKTDKFMEVNQMLTSLFPNYYHTPRTQNK